MIFLEEKTHRVELSSDELGSLGEGKLIFGGGLPISVQLSMMSPLQSGETEYPVGVVHAKSEKGQSFTLHECKAYGQTIYAEYLIVGNPSSRSDRFIVFVLLRIAN